MTWVSTRAAVLRAATSVGVAAGSAGLSFGALATASGLTVVQACALSLLTFTGGSQFALIGAIGAGGSPVSGSASALLLGTRNLLYGARLSPLLQLAGWRKVVGAQLVIDETTAVALAKEEAGHRAARLAFWATGLATFSIWNGTTLVGALAGAAIGDPRTLGLDAAVPAAFIALLAPRLRDRTTWLVALAAAALAVAVVPLVPAGVPVLVAVAVPLVAVLLSRGAE